MEPFVIDAEELKAFKQELVEELKQALGKHSPEEEVWLKSADVRKKLRISPGTLQSLRVNGSLRYSKLGSIMYYLQEDINKLLKANMIDNAIPRTQKKRKGL